MSGAPPPADGVVTWPALARRATPRLSANTGSDTGASKSNTYTWSNDATPGVIAYAARAAYLGAIYSIKHTGDAMPNPATDRQWDTRRAEKRRMACRKTQHVRGVPRRRARVFASLHLCILCRAA